MIYYGDLFILVTRGTIIENTFIENFRLFFFTNTYIFLNLFFDFHYFNISNISLLNSLTNKSKRKLFFFVILSFFFFN